VSNLSLKNVFASLNGKPVLSDISLNASSGDMTVICGPNGAGKSTLLRSIAGLVSEVSGDIALDDIRLSDLAVHEVGQHVAYLPQDQLVHWPLTVEAIVQLSRRPHLQAFGRASQDDLDAVEAALEKTGMSDFRDRPITQLSGGERARAFLARLLASDASVYLVDEPLAALDPYYQMAVLEVLKQAANEGKIVITVVHDLSIARRYFDTAFLLKDGKVLRQGKVSDVIAPEALSDAYDIETVITSEGGIEAVRRLK